jgi:uncharacterized cysteine cluster protein YcgN (CxxCxxCC family)
MRGAVGPERADKPFWQAKALEEMSVAEWESLCDGCARCCLLKLEDEETGKLYQTRLACRLLDLGTCRCSDYEHRHARVHDCLAIDAVTARTLTWLPETCAYRLLAERKDLYWWHPLVSGDPDTVHAAGVSVRGWTKSEAKVKPEHVDRYIIRGFRRGR